MDFSTTNDRPVPWLRAGNYTVNPRYLLAIRRGTRTGHDRATGYPMEIPLAEVLTSIIDTDGKPWSFVVTGADAQCVFALADMLAAGDIVASAGGDANAAR